MFVEATDFTDIPYKFPNAEEVRGLAAFIESEETKLLKKVLGLDLYNEFIAGLEDSSIAQKYIELRDGAEYTYGTKTYEYAGVIDLLKPYIYSRLVELNYRKLTSSGVIINQGQENTLVQNPTYEVVTYWNEAVGKIGGYLNQINTLYGFLEANSDTYDTWEFEELKPKNQLDL